MVVPENVIEIGLKWKETSQNEPAEQKFKNFLGDNGWTYNEITPEYENKDNVSKEYIISLIPDTDSNYDLVFTIQDRNPRKAHNNIKYTIELLDTCLNEDSISGVVLKYHNIKDENKQELKDFLHSKGHCYEGDVEYWTNLK